MTRPAVVQVAAGRTLPLPALRILGVAVAAASFVIVPSSWAIVAVCLAMLGAVMPGSLLTWGAIVVIALAQLAHPLTLDWRPSVVLVIVHLLHVIGGATLPLPAAGRVQVKALVPIARRWLVLQVIAQALLLAALAASRLPLGGVLPAGAVAIGSAVAVVIMMVLVRVLTLRR